MTNYHEILWLYAQGINQRSINRYGACHLSY